jgi:hypothetical protein
LQTGDGGVVIRHNARFVEGAILPH